MLCGYEKALALVREALATAGWTVVKSTWPSTRLARRGPPPAATSVAAKRRTRRLPPSVTHRFLSASKAIFVVGAWLPTRFKPWSLTEPVKFAALELRFGWPI